MVKQLHELHGMSGKLYLPVPVPRSMTLLPLTDKIGEEEVNDDEVDGRNDESATKLRMFLDNSMPPCQV